MSSDKVDRLSDAVYAHEYFAELQDLTIAAQIRVIREQRVLTQEELAKLAGISQARISQLEGGDGSVRTLSTLRKLARAFDVGIRVCFAPFMDSLRELERQSPESLRVIPRSEEMTQKAPTQYAEFPQHARGGVRIDAQHQTTISATTVSGTPSLRLVA
jgi:transcriptional regulator with XRE-family HTH domain